MADDLKNTSDDEKLICETLSGDVLAFGGIIERYWDMVVVWS